MNLYLDSILFALIVLIYWVISEMFTILFRFAGLPDEKARFQVLSLLTGTGFTTHESEMILTTPRRRRLARITILFGYVFNLTIVTIIINAFLALRLSQAEHEFLAVLAPLGSVALIFAFIRIVLKVTHIGDVTYITHLIAKMHQIAIEDIKGDSRTSMT